MSEISGLKEALRLNLELVQALSRRIEILEAPQEENAARMVAVMTLIRSMYLCAPNRQEIGLMVERFATQMQAQPGFVLGNMHNFRKMQEHLNWLMRQPVSLG